MHANPLSRWIDPATHQPRSPLFWAVLGALVAAQLVAFWLLCSHQVRKAEARRTEALAHQMALADCLQYVPGSTLASCASQLQAQGTNGPGHALAAAPLHAPAMGGATPVNFTFR